VKKHSSFKYGTHKITGGFELIFVHLWVSNKTFLHCLPGMDMNVLKFVSEFSNHISDYINS